MTHFRQTAHEHRKTRLRFELGGFEAEGFELRLSRGHLLYAKTVGPFPAQPPQVIQPSEEQWQQFWQDVDHIGVWTWLPEYVNLDVLDGMQWSLSLSHAGLKMDSEGSNAYPGSDPDGDPDEYPDDSPFAEFLRALAALLSESNLAQILKTGAAE